MIMRKEYKQSRNFKELVPKNYNSVTLSGKQHTPGQRLQRGFAEIPVASVYPVDKETEQKKMLL